LLLTLFFSAALDLVDKLLSFSTPRHIQEMRRRAEMVLKVAYCSRIISKHTHAVLAVGVLLSVREQQGLREDYLDFIPAFLLTDEAQACAHQLKCFIAQHVHTHIMQQKQVTTSAVRQSVQQKV